MLNFLQALAKMKKPETGLLEGIAGAVQESAAKTGLRSESYANGWKAMNKESAVVVVQFGGRRDFYVTMEMLEKKQCDYRVIITSSNVKSMKAGEIKWLLNNRYQTKNKWLITDIEGRESPKTVNFMLYGSGESGEKPEMRGVRERPRRKRIIGRRGEHKEQD